LIQVFYANDKCVQGSGVILVWSINRFGELTRMGLLQRCDMFIVYIPVHYVNPRWIFNTVRHFAIEHAVGGVAQWLGCRYLAGGLSLTCARSMVDR